MESNNLEKRCFLCRTVVEIVSSGCKTNICTLCPPGSETIYYCSDEHLSVHRGKSHHNRIRKPSSLVFTNPLLHYIDITSPVNSNETGKILATSCNENEATNGVKPNTICWPFCIETRPTIGRIMVATRDIRAGETILEESPAVWGPNNKSSALCLECLKPAVKSDANNSEKQGHSVSLITKCSKCRFPICGNECK